MISVLHAKRWDMKYMFGQHIDPITNKIHLGSILIMGVQGDARSTHGWRGMGHTKEIEPDFLYEDCRHEFGMISVVHAMKRLCFHPCRVYNNVVSLDQRP